MYGRPLQEHRVPTTIVDTNLCARNLANKQERSRCIGTEHIDTRYCQLSIRTIGKQEQFKKRAFLAWGVLGVSLGFLFYVILGYNIINNR